MYSLFELHYLPNIQYFSEIIHAGKIQLEKFSSYERQTYRNRCDILTANGTQTLSIPVEKNKSSKLMKDIKIAYHQNWQHQHWMAIVSAYQSSPFFECISGDLANFYTQKTTFLWDFNRSILSYFIDLLEVNIKLKESENFTNFPDKVNDLRALSDKPPEIIMPAYKQVFSDRFRFVPNLSIIDLICNEGGNSFSYLTKLNHAK